MTYDDYHVVEELADGNVILVGEKHGCSRSADLMAQVIEDFEPQSIAIEKQPHGIIKPGGAMAVASRYGRRNGLQLAKIDEYLLTNGGLWDNIQWSWTKYISDANKFVQQPDESGDIPASVTEATRSRIYEEYGEEGVRLMYDDREVPMVQRLRWIEENWETPTVAAVGAFHVQSMADIWRNGDKTRELTENRIQEYDD